MTSNFEAKILKVKTALENVFIKKSNTVGLVKNDGSIDTNSYSTFSGSYVDLSNKPSIPRVFYGTCSSTAGSQVKEVTTSPDYNLQTGTILFVKFQYGQSYNADADNPTQLKVNNSATNVDVAFNAESKGTRYHWYTGEVVCFVYDGTNFVMENEAVATTTYYGVTKLSSSTSSTSTSLAATPSAVKTVADAKADKTDGVSQITDSNASGYSNISGSLTSSSTQADINSAINTELGDISDMIGDAISYINQ